ncbi:hypothetical protein PhaeoP83_00791 [Phaeobacter inhibens]|uniref:HTH LytTR-type domain-containing protein n=1 Tax=Phaeobacter inhibens TaxID=221822 RepID=A0A2I7KBD1_9RHOB|nr:LytTR family DNA-binding domain-containing protein [Phaeobacter inhibens]AUQ49090.1 hypothetical protein PhaeoP83_00791 [Phaeobacter inhibens]AUQ65773.1 hypothetical protein PhaeoP78_00892 [Phaeobacter inhibens]AUQ93590.1 hypothetical protein PhaeoP66_00784 [Phaeobacter inhibens]AUQ99908.1 hypothetical protein PhaeoP88_02553 [Phaeobacter inhibens]AUR18893.1 hypothetical protein PhaeoP80_00791 [Phaeobacter inhibens]
MPQVTPHNKDRPSQLDTVFQTLFGLRDISWQQLAGYCLWFSVLGSVIITSFEPVATAELHVALAALLWFLHLLVATFLMSGVTVLGVLAGLRMPWPLVLAVLLLPVLLTPVSFALDSWFGGEPRGITRGFGLGWELLMEFLDIVTPSLGLAALAGIFAYRAADLARRYQRSLLAVPSTEPALKTVVPEVPHHLGDDLIRAEAQGHYVKIVTAAGNITLKLAFSDCVTALKPFLGAQCHRSHWVRFKHVTSVKRQGSAYTCLLEDGTEIPVSRRRYAALRRKL